MPAHFQDNFFAGLMFCSSQKGALGTSVVTEHGRKESCQEGAKTWLSKYSFII